VGNKYNDDDDDDDMRLFKKLMECSFHRDIMQIQAEKCCFQSPVLNFDLGFLTKRNFFSQGYYANSGREVLLSVTCFKL
jgi:hypothetical protein